ncbi:hypothetical protein [Kitasatospora sp. NPDC087271]|uniref:hypothetical protein n=1 Tax=Kitasatospora sp. NPDC087271 TaxID=3364067 RepID=UPI0037FC77A7
MLIDAYPVHQGNYFKDWLTALAAPPAAVEFGEARTGTAENTEEMHALFNRAAKVYGQSGVEFLRSVGRRLVEFSGISAGASVLDVRSGRGALLFPVAEVVGAGGGVVGIDISLGV